MAKYFTKNEAGEYVEVEVDDAEKLKKSLTESREDTKKVKAKLKELEDLKAKIEEDKLSKEKEFQTLWEQSKAKATQAEKELQALKDEVANSKRDALASNLVNSVTKDTSRAEVLKNIALQYIQASPDGVIISSDDGAINDEKKLIEHLSLKYPFLVDGPDSSGGGSRGSASTSVNKKWSEMTEKEHVALYRSDPKKAKEMMNAG